MLAPARQTCHFAAPPTSNPPCPGTPNAPIQMATPLSSPTKSIARGCNKFKPPPAVPTHICSPRDPPSTPLFPDAKPASAPVDFRSTAATHPPPCPIHNAPASSSNIICTATRSGNLTISCGCASSPSANFDTRVPVLIHIPPPRAAANRTGFGIHRQQNLPASPAKNPHLRPAREPHLPLPHPSRQPNICPRRQTLLHPKMIHPCHLEFGKPPHRKQTKDSLPRHPPPPDRHTRTSGAPHPPAASNTRAKRSHPNGSPSPDPVHQPQPLPCLSKYKWSAPPALQAPSANAPSKTFLKSPPRQTASTPPEVATHKCPSTPPAPHPSHYYPATPHPSCRVRVSQEVRRAGSCPRHQRARAGWAKPPLSNTETAHKPARKNLSQLGTSPIYFVWRSTQAQTHAGQSLPVARTASLLVHRLRE